MMDGGRSERNAGDIVGWVESASAVLAVGGNILCGKMGKGQVEWSTEGSSTVRP